MSTEVSHQDLGHLLIVPTPIHRIRNLLVPEDGQLISILV
jgi:hypothetical protein